MALNAAPCLPSSAAQRLPTLPRCHAHTHALNPRHVKYDLLSGQMKPNSFAVCEAYKFIRRRRVSSGGQCGGQYGEGEVCMRASGHSKVNSKLANSQFENLQIRISHIQIEFVAVPQAGNRTKECSKFIYKYNCTTRGCMCVHVCVLRHSLC